MKAKIVYLSEDMPVRICKSRTRSIRLRVLPADVRLSLPFFVSYQRGLAFLKTKEAWIRQKKVELGGRPLPFLHQGNQEEYQRLRAQAKKAVEESLKRYAPLYNVSPKKVIIRNQKTRFGSCSLRGTLSFSYRVLLLPSALREYVVVHEICHLLEFNHSPRFWKLVAQTFPDYQETRKALKEL